MSWVMCTLALRECEIALYDIDGQRLQESEQILQTINRNANENRAVICSYLGEENRTRWASAALCGPVPQCAGLLGNTAE